MAKDNFRDARRSERGNSDDEEARSLLPEGSTSREGSPDIETIAKPANGSANGHSLPPGLPRRQSSIAQPRPPGTPRTPNRVRFEIEEANGAANGLAGGEWVEEEDFMSSNGRANSGGRMQRIPLLTDIEAPSVTVATDEDFNPEDLLESARPKSGMRSAFMNMANSIIGAGIIGQPYAFRQAGLVTGTLLLVALTVTVDWTIRLIVINSKLSGQNSFQATVEHCFGKSGLIAISIAQWALEIAKLAKASTLALISMLVIIFTVITQGPRVPADMRGQLRGSLLIHNGVFRAIGVISFDHNSLLIYGSLKKPTIDRFTKVTHYSTSISCAACMAMALSGYLTFGDETQGNVLNNFPADNILVNVARFCFGLNMLTTLPLEAFVCREVMTLYYFAHEPFNPNRHLIFSTALVVSAMTLSLITCDLGIVFELVGATSACALAYILPPLCFIKLSSRSWKTALAWVCVVFGCTVMGISLMLAVMKIMRSELRLAGRR
ncbi:hypothetical protein LTR04_000661 [Oleoguttula sp. CCFEE 6159]|nr:hypothetical protein LTR04_000661 [Oleoguttula sp. CCFEE 6159]